MYEAFAASWWNASFDRCGLRKGASTFRVRNHRGNDRRRCVTDIAAALFRRPGGLILVLAMWLCLVPAPAQGSAAAAWDRGHSAPWAATAASAGLPDAVAPETKARSDAKQNDPGGSGDAAFDAPPRAAASFWNWAAGHALPAATAPPAPAPSRANQARAPPLR